MTPSPDLSQRVPAKTWPSSNSNHDDDDDDDDDNDNSNIDLLHHSNAKQGKTGDGFFTPDTIRSLTGSPVSAAGDVPPISIVGPSRPGLGSRTWTARVSRAWAPFWRRNRGMLLVASSQVFGSLMNLAARLLELESGMHPFQILFARMGITTVIACIYMYKAKVPGFPLGAREVRGLLVVRGLTGFFGIYGMWYSMMYLPLAEATVISFLAPGVSGYICHVLLHEPYTRKEQIASLLALIGVVFIARPISFFSTSGTSGDMPVSPETAANATASNATVAEPYVGHEPTPAQRLSAIGVALSGVLGAAGAYTTIRAIGKRAHPLISVNYFSTWCTIVSTTVLLLAPVLDIGQPALHFALPASVRQWLLLLFLGACGMMMQFLLTSGLGGEKSNRATAMLYTQMLFAAGFDRWVFGHEMGPLSLVGCGFIVGGALWAALTRSEQGVGRPDADVEATAAGDGVESQAMLLGGHRIGEGDGEEDGGEGTRIAMRQMP